MALFHTTVLDEQIKALPTVDTASGSIATFDTDMTENLVEVNCQIVAQQSGSGTPSPDNVRPIQTYSEMNVSACGKNLANVKAYSNWIVIGAYSIQKGLLPNNQRCVMSFSDNDTTVDASGCYLGFINSEYSGGSLSGNDYRWVMSNGTIQSNTKNVSNDNPNTYLTGLFIYPNNETTYNKIFSRWNIQIELGETTSDYEPFNGTTANIPFGQTVAQGVLNVGTGKLRVTHGYVDMGTLNYTQQASTATYQDFSNAALASLIKPPSDVFGIIDGACSVFRLASRNDQSGTPTDNLNTLGVAGSGTIRIVTPPNEYATPTDLKTALNGQLLVYELATPQEIQLDSTQITALLNENNIWCDTGDTSVKYILSVGKAIS